MPELYHYQHNNATETALSRKKGGFCDILIEPVAASFNVELTTGHGQAHQQQRITYLRRGEKMLYNRRHFMIWFYYTTLI